MFHVQRLSTPPVLASHHDAGLCARLIGAGAGESPYDRWSFYPQPPTRLLVCDRHGRGSLHGSGGVVGEFATPQATLRYLESTLTGAAPTPTDPDVPPFVGGWVGYFSYDLGRCFEALPARAVDDLGLPLLALTFHPRTYALDHRTGQWFAARCQSALDGPPLVRPPLVPRGGGPGPLVGTHTPESFAAAVGRVLDYIGAGDAFQVNLSHRWSTALREAPAVIFDRAAARVPAWYGAYLSYGDFALISNSPELFLQVTPQADGSRRVLTRPIKGTRPRGAGMEQALRQSLKDQAELNMIVDLERNDLGRICRVGSVRVTEARRIEAHPTVHHGAATIQGTLRQDVSLVDLLAATFPGGSVTGAPKIRAMQIIDELEPVRRGPYCGSIGYLSLSGDICLNLAIRTLIATPETIHLNVGGGIVADSDPAEEYRETLVKARQLLAALGR